MSILTYAPFYSCSIIENLQDLFKFGGFPENLNDKNVTNLKRWHFSRLSKLVREDLRDLETVKDIDKVELLAEELVRRVASPLSYNSLARDLDIAPKTAKRWVEILDSLYFCFRISPYGSAKIRAVKKEQKLYLWDWSQIEDKGERFENMVACFLLKFCHYQQDVNGEKYDLRYIRDTDKREIDFVVLKNNIIQFAVECKFKNKSASTSLFYFQKKLKIDMVYQVDFNGPEKQVNDSIKLINIIDLCKYEKLV